MLTSEEIIAMFMAIEPKPKPAPPKPKPAAVVKEERWAKPTEAMLRDAALHNEAVAELLAPEIVADCKEKVVEVWGKVEEELARRGREETAAKEAADFGELRRRMKARFAEHQEASSFLPATQPPADDAQQSSEEGQETAPTLVPVSPREPLLLNPGAPFDNAQKLVTEYHWHTVQRVRTLQRYQKDFWKWDGTHWVQVDDDAARSDLFSNELLRMQDQSGAHWQVGSSSGKCARASLGGRIST